MLETEEDEAAAAPSAPVTSTPTSKPGSGMGPIAEEGAAQTPPS